MPKSTKNDMMKARDFHTNNYADRYVSGHLSQEEEDRFEEHMLTCARCREEVSLTEEIVQGIRVNPIQSGIRSATPKKRIGIPLSIAASIALLVGLSIYFITKSHGTKNLVESDQKIHADSIFYRSPVDSVPNKEVNPTQTNTPDKKDDLLTEAFVPLPVFENAIKNQVRAEQINIQKPQLNQEFSNSKQIEFVWSEGPDDLSLVIFDNTGNILLEKKATSPFQLQQVLAPGLYYWQLEDKEEALFVGKFVVSG